MDDDEIEHIFLEDEDEISPGPQEHTPGSGPARAVDNQEERTRFKRMLIGILLVSAMLTLIRGIEVQRFLADFMAVFSISFAALKFADIETFAHAYCHSDILAGRIRPWGYAFPFVQAFIGFWYMLTEAPLRLNIVTLLVAGTAAVGAARAVKQPGKAQYAYHSTLLRLPLPWVSRIENVTMFVVAAVLLFV